MNIWQIRNSAHSIFHSSEKIRSVNTKKFGFMNGPRNPFSDRYPKGRSFKRVMIDERNRRHGISMKTKPDSHSKSQDTRAFVE